MKKFKMQVVLSEALKVKSFKEGINKHTIDQMENQFGIKVNPEDVLIQIRIWNGEGEEYVNYSDKTYTFAKALGIEIPRCAEENQRELWLRWAFGSHYVPYNLVKDSKTGDILTFTTTLGQTFEVEINQGAYVNGEWDDTFEKARDEAYEYGKQYEFK